jgi:cytochrome c peroxidase
MLLFKLHITKKSWIVTALFFLTFLPACQLKYESAEKITLDQLSVTYNINLSNCIFYLDSLRTVQSVSKAMEYYFAARKYFKYLEPVMAYTESDNYLTLNQPNLIQVAEEDRTDIRVTAPQGFQVMEENIFGEEPQLKALHQEANFIYSRLKLIQKNMQLHHYQDYHFLWLFRDQVLRTALIGVTGYDSPSLQHSLLEAEYTYDALIQYLRVFQHQFSDPGLFDNWLITLEASKKCFRNANFESFDRYRFIKEQTQFQLALWNQTVTDWQVVFPFEMAIQNEAVSLFDTSTFNLQYFAGRQALIPTASSVALGKMLFEEQALSANQKMSCATCHQPQKAFTDGRILAITNDQSSQKRNSPTLTYAAYQKGFFYDRRVGNLEGQIVNVFHNKQEFNTDLEIAVSKVKGNKTYDSLAKVVFDEPLNSEHIKSAIASYVRKLAPFSSKFDQNMRGVKNDISQQEIKGFNLFMGKAACGTCHFAPLFNGTLPTRFKESELEALGVPETDENLEVDDDFGRYDMFQTIERKYFFKTPSIRNIAQTAPYMHNGVYQTLEQVMNFYNKGGGAGMGFTIPHQTLPFDSLSLSDEESKAIIAFMETLSDSPKTTQSNRLGYLSLE